VRYVGAGPQATADRRGAMPAGAYRAFAGVGPTFPTTAPASLALASGTWSEATATNVAATRGPTVSNLTYRRCHSLGHVTAGTVMRPVMLLPGFGGDGVTEFPQALRRSLADAGLLVIAPITQGRGSVSGELHYSAFETQALLDILAAAVTAAEAAGATVYGGGRCAWFLSSSTGAIDLGLMLQRAPEAVLGGTVLYPNHDLIRYHELVASSTLTALETQVAVLGAREPAALDYYTAVSLDAIARVLALPECTAELHIGGDETEAPTVPIPLPSDLVAMARGEHAARAKVGYHITTSSDDSNDRILHNSGATSTGVTRFNYRWIPSALVATEWKLSAVIEALRAPGMFRRRGVSGSADPSEDRAALDLWFAPTTAGVDDTAASRGFAADVSVTSDGLLKIEPVTTTAGFVEVITGSTSRVVALEPHLTIDLNAAPPIYTVADLAALGVTHAWFSDEGVTGGGTITAWAEASGFGAISLTAAANNPASATDSDGIPTVRFTSASSQKLMAASLPFSPAADYTLVVVYSIPTSAAGQIVNLTHQGTFDTLSFGVTSTPQDIVYYRNNAYAVATAGGTGVGGHTVSTATKHVSVVRRLGLELYESLDLGTESHAAIDPAKDTFITTGTNHMTVGAGLADSGNPAVPFEFKSVDVYAILAAPINLTPAEGAGIAAYLRRRFVFGSAPAVRTPVGAPAFEVDMTIHATDFTGRLHTAHQVDLSGSAVTVALPDPATCPGHELLISQVVAGTANLILTPSAGKVEGASSLTIAGAGSGAGIAKRLYSYGAAAVGWKVV